MIPQTSATTKSDTGTDPAKTQNTKLKDPLTQTQTFLTLLCAQLKNQDPLNPTDGTAFLSQLAQFTELEQVTAIRTNLDKMAGNTTPTDGTTGTTGDSSSN